MRRVALACALLLIIAAITPILTVALAGDYPSAGDKADAALAAVAAVALGALIPPKPSKRGNAR